MRGNYEVPQNCRANRATVLRSIVITVVQLYCNAGEAAILPQPTKTRRLGPLTLVVIVKGTVKISKLLMTSCIK